MEIELKVTGIEGVLATLQALPAEVVSARGGPVRASLRKGALVILKAEKANLSAAIKDEEDSTGLLLKNLVVTRGKAPNDGKGERYLVRVRRKVYPGTGKGTNREAVSTIKAAQLKEYGSSHQQPSPFIRPAFESRAGEAIETTQTELLKAIDKIVAKLKAQNQGK